MNMLKRYWFLMLAMFGLAVANAQAFVIATLPAEITTLMTDAGTLRDSAITFKVVVIGAIIGFTFILWITRRK